MSNTIYLLDGHSLAHRAFYALPLLTNEQGEYTNAVFGFARMLFKLMDEQQPDLLTVAFDRKAPTFRHQEYEEYKATRKKMPEELHPQIDLIKEMLGALNIPTFSKEGYEADDVIGTLARRAEETGLEVVIVTGDRDALQLVTESTRVMYTRKGITDIVDYDLEKVRDKYELEPEKLVDMKGLMGDSSDNIPGVPGIGEKTATKLLKQFCSMEEILVNIDQVSGKKRKENLRKYSEQAKMSKMLGKILQDIPLDVDLEDCRVGEPDSTAVVELFKRLEFNSLLDRFEEGLDREILEVEIEQIAGDRLQKLVELAEDCRRQSSMAFTFIFNEEDDLINFIPDHFLIYSGGNTAYLLPVKSRVIGVFTDIFEDEEIEKYLIKSKENALVLKNLGLELKGLAFDPLLAEYLIDSSGNLPEYEEILEKEINCSLPEDTEPEQRNALLLKSLSRLQDSLRDKLKQRELLALYEDIELPLVRVLAEMEFNGIRVNEDYLNQLSKKWAERLETITQKAHELAGEEFNLNSPQQLGEILFEKLGLPVIKKTKTGYSTSIDVLDELEDKHEIIPLIKEYRQWSKFKSTYVDALPPLINSRTGRIHSSFNQMVTATGRLSSTEPNLQNIPIRKKEGREIRKAFVPRDQGWVLLAADYSQVELRILAHISEDSGLKEAFNRGQDIHTQTAAEVFEVDRDEVTPNLRRHAKVINFGIAYGMSAYGLAQDLDIPRKEAEEYIDRYFERFSGVKKYMDQIIEQARDNNYVTTIFNRRRYLPQINSRNYHRRQFAERAAINTPIQGSAADIMKIAMINFYRALKESEYSGRLLLQVHDELVLETPKTELEGIAGLLKTEMEQAVDLSVPLPVDLQVGDNWCDKRDFSLEGEKGD